MGLPITQTRLSNASKVQATYLYAYPWRIAIPVLQLVLFIIAAGAFGLGTRTSWNAGDFFLRAFILLLLVIYHPIELLRRYQRLPSAFEATISPSSVLCSWLLYGSIGFSKVQKNLPNWVICGPGLLVGAIYVGFAGDALRREMKAVRQGVKEVDLEIQGRGKLPHPSDSPGPSRPPFEQKKSRETLFTDTQLKDQKWSPLGM